MVSGVDARSSCKLKKLISTSGRKTKPFQKREMELKKQGRCFVWESGFGGKTKVNQISCYSYGGGVEGPQPPETKAYSTGLGQKGLTEKHVATLVD